MPRDDDAAVTPGATALPRTRGSTAGVRDTRRGGRAGVQQRSTFATHETSVPISRDRDDRHHRQLVLEPRPCRDMASAYDIEGNAVRRAAGA